VHGRQLGEHGIHERFSPRAGQISEIEQSIDSHRRWQGCFVCAGHPLFEQKDRIGCGDVSMHPEVVDRLRWCQTEPSAGRQNDRTPAQGGGPAWVQGALRCGVGGGDQHRTGCQGNPFEIGQRPSPGGIWDGGGRSFGDLDLCLQVVAFVSMAIFS
jgi:hypothetical protein